MEVQKGKRCLHSGQTLSIINGFLVIDRLGASQAVNALLRQFIWLDTARECGIMKVQKGKRRLHSGQTLLSSPKIDDRLDTSQAVIAHLSGKCTVQ